MKMIVVCSTFTVGSLPQKSEHNFDIFPLYALSVDQGSQPIHSRILSERSAESMGRNKQDGINLVKQLSPELKGHVMRISLGVTPSSCQMLLTTPIIKTESDLHVGLSHLPILICKHFASILLLDEQNPGKSLNGTMSQYQPTLRIILSYAFICILPFSSSLRLTLPLLISPNLPGMTKPAAKCARKAKSPTSRTMVRISWVALQAESASVSTENLTC